jgi:hypothetical protein
MVADRGERRGNCVARALVGPRRSNHWIIQAEVAIRRRQGSGETAVKKLD